MSGPLPVESAGMTGRSGSNCPLVPEVQPDYKDKLDNL